MRGGPLCFCALIRQMLLFEDHAATDSGSQGTEQRQGGGERLRHFGHLPRAFIRHGTDAVRHGLCDLIFLCGHQLPVLTLEHGDCGKHGPGDHAALLDQFPLSLGPLAGLPECFR